jgi:hypothetical protein
MGVLSGHSVATFAEATHGLLEGASLNAPYPFHWVEVQRVEGRTLVCTGGGKPMRLPFRKTPLGERASVTIQDPFFGPQRFPVRPFKREDIKHG